MNLITFQTLNPIYLEGYYIYFRPQSNANPLNNEYKVISVLHSGDTSAFEINDLMKYTEYEFFLLPFYKDIEGRPSNLRIAKTLEDGEFQFHSCTRFKCTFSTSRYIKLIFFLRNTSNMKITITVEP